MHPNKMGCFFYCKKVPERWGKDMRKENTANTTTATKDAKALPKAIMNKPVMSETDKIMASQKKLFDKHTTTIRKEMASVERSFLKIGHALFQISTLYNSKTFKTVGYKDIYDYAHKEFGIARGTCSDFIHIIEKFAKRDENGNVLCELEDNYGSYSSSKLSILITMSEEELKEVNPNMTVKEIKATKKGKNNHPSDSSNNGSADENDNDTDIIDDDDYEISNVVISFRTLEEYEKNIDKLDDLILRCLKAGHKVSVSETVPKVRTSEQ